MKESLVDRLFVTEKSQLITKIIVARSKWNVATDKSNRTSHKTFMPKTIDS